jgi:protocatechuate 3,4-dioxygenase beta subunit
MSRRLLKQFELFLLALSILSIGQTVSAGDPVKLQAATKSITGTVFDVNNAAAANAQVALYSLKPKGSAPQPLKPGESPTGDPPAGKSTIGAPDAIPLQKPSDTLIAKTQTDAAGKFTFNAVAPGPYLVVAGTGRNIAKVNVDVTDKANPAPLTLKLPSK